VPALTLSASAPVRYLGESVGVVRGGVVLDAAFLARLKRAAGVELVLSDGAGQRVATTFDDALPLPPAARLEAGHVTLAGRSYLSRSAALAIGPEPHARITGLVSTAAADQTIGALRTTSVLLGLVGLAIAIGLGAWWSSQVSRPVEQLAAFSERIARGRWDEPLALHSVRELQTLVAALDRMRRELSAYRARLVTSERQAAWSQMARMVAHEVKNPLTPIAVSVADLKRSFDQQRADFPEILDQAVATIAAEVDALKHLLQEFSDFARLPAPTFASCRLSDLMADLKTLYGAEVARGRLTFDATGPDVTFTADRGQLRQALINLIKNGLEAAGDSGRVEVRAGVAGADLTLAVSDSGPGFSAEEKANLFVPDFTTKAHGSGLGLTIVERIVNDHGGTITVAADPARGTTFRILCPLKREA
jgi:nitrogen fixation/metabolism regulation signal transduction histidine kinase